ncbi:MAG: hypothetical protein SGBAC_005617 [Bacillariaceae sp.]
MDTVTKDESPPHQAETGAVVNTYLEEEEGSSSSMAKAKFRQPQSQRTWYRLIVIIFLLLITLCIFMGLYFTELSRKTENEDAESSNVSDPSSPDDESPTGGKGTIESPTESPTDEQSYNPFHCNPKLARLYSALSPVASPTFYMANDTLNTKSEYMAWKWISEFDGFTSDTFDDSTPDWKIVERYALAEFYYATNGEGWINQYNFLSNSPVCDWHGTSSFHFGVRFCSDEGSITMLQLPFNNLEGSLPASLPLLSNLASLDLPKNLIDGTIPLEISKLSSLSGRLDLSHNRIIGSIPQSMGALTNLAELLLQYNRLDGEISPEILAMTSLTSMNLGSNLLSSSLPEHIGRLTLLKDLRLNDNQLTGKLPSSIGQLSRLHKLQLQQNQLTGDIPTSLSNLENNDAHSFNLFLHANNFSTEASMEFLCQDNAVCSSRIMGCSSDCLSAVQCSCCGRCYDSKIAMCAKVSPSLDGCRMIMDDNLNKQSSVLQAKNPLDDPSTFLGWDTDFAFVVTDKINIDSEDSAYSVYGSIPVNGGPFSYSPGIGVPDVTCQELMTDDWYAMRDDSQLRFMEVPGYPCTEFGKRIIYRLIMEWLYFG